LDIGGDMSPLPRPCKHCTKRFQPTGKFQRVCDKCADRLAHKPKPFHNETTRHQKLIAKLKEYKKNKKILNFKIVEK